MNQVDNDTEASSVLLALVHQTTGWATERTDDILLFLLDSRHRKHRKHRKRHGVQRIHAIARASLQRSHVISSTSRQTLC